MSNLFFPKLQGLDWSYEIQSEHSTDISTTQAGNEVRIRQWNSPKRTITLNYEFLKDDLDEIGQPIAGGVGYTDLRTIMGFFDARGGSFDDFLLRVIDFTQNPADGPVLNQIIGIGDGVKQSFQLVRRFGESLEIIQNCFGVVPYVNGVRQSTTTYQTNSTGLLTFTTAPASGTKITVDFDWCYRCRFNTDTMKAGAMYYKLYEMQQVELLQVFL